jgi:hypothetical protein
MIHFKQRLLPNLPHDLEIVTVNEGESTNQYHTPLAVAKFTGKRKKIKSGYFIATPRIRACAVSWYCVPTCAVSCHRVLVHRNVLYHITVYLYTNTCCIVSQKNEIFAFHLKHFLSNLKVIPSPL